MAEKPTLKLRVLRAPDGVASENSTFVDETGTHPDLMAALWAYVEANPGTRKIEVEISSGDQ